MIECDNKKPEHPGVNFPPPLLFALGFAVSLLVHKFHPLYLFTDRLTGVFSIIGGFFLLIGLAVMMWGLLTFLRFRTAVFPNQPGITGRHFWTVSIQSQPNVCRFYRSLYGWNFIDKYAMGSVAASRSSPASANAGDQT